MKTYTHGGYSMAPYWMGGAPAEHGPVPPQLQFSPSYRQTDSPNVFGNWILDLESALAVGGWSLFTQTSGNRVVYRAGDRVVAEAIQVPGGFMGVIHAWPTGRLHARVGAEEIRRLATWKEYPGTYGYRGYGQIEPFLVPKAPPKPPRTITPEMVKGLAIRYATLTDSRTDPANPNTLGGRVSPVGPILLGAGIIGGIATALTRSKLGPTGTIVAGTASGAAAVGGAAATVGSYIGTEEAREDKNRLDDMLAMKMPPATVTQSDTRVNVERSWINPLPTDAEGPGKGFAVERGSNPYILARVQPQMQVRGRHRRACWKKTAFETVCTGPENPSLYWYENIWATPTPDLARVGRLEEWSVTPKRTRVGAGWHEANWAVCDRVSNRIEYHSSGSWAYHFFSYLTFYEEGTEKVLFRAHFKYRSKSLSCLKEWKIEPGDYGVIPAFIVFDGVNNSFLRGNTPAIGADKPIALTEFEASPEAEKLPMGAVQTLYRLFRLYRPETFAMAGTPMAWCMLLVKTGDVEEVQSGWASVFKSVLQVVNAATAIASVCFPVLGAIAPAAAAFISGITQTATTSYGEVIDSIRSNRGNFGNIYRNYEEMFENWKLNVQGGALPPEWDPLNIVERVNKMADSEYIAASSSLATMWMASPVGKADWTIPNTPFTLHSVHSYIEPEEDRR